jgi:hypothetical protein
MKEGGWDGKVTHKSLAMRYLLLFIAPGRGSGHFPDHRSRSGWKKFKMLAQRKRVGTTISRCEKPK